MAFLPSLLYTGTRFAGQRERTKQFFEAGVGGFPNDYPLVAAYDQVTGDRAEEEQARWERTPPAKKPNYEKLGTRSPWRPDWGVVLGLEEPAATRSPSGEQGEEELVTTQRENADAMHVDEEGSEIQPWLLRGPRVSTMLSNAFITPAQFLCEINKLRSKNHMVSLEASPSAEDLMRTALVMVRAKMILRGAPSDMANIYKMEDPEARKWIKTFEKPSGGADNWGESSEPNEHEVSSLVSSRIADSHTLCVLFLAWRDQVFSDGRYWIRDDGGRLAITRRGPCDWCDSRRTVLGAPQTSIEVCKSLICLFAWLRKVFDRLSQPSVLVKVRDRDCTTCRVAYLELLDA